MYVAKCRRDGPLMVRVLPPGTIATDVTTPTVGRADTATKKEAGAANATAKKGGQQRQRQ
jgi:hypothetical protein